MFLLTVRDLALKTTSSTLEISTFFFLFHNETESDNTFLLEGKLFPLKERLFLRVLQHMLFILREEKM